MLLHQIHYICVYLDVDMGTYIHLIGVYDISRYSPKYPRSMVYRSIYPISAVGHHIWVYLQMYAWSSGRCYARICICTHAVLGYI
jgi:hypothetical protein